MGWGHGAAQKAKLKRVAARVRACSLPCLARPSSSLRRTRLPFHASVSIRLLLPPASTSCLYTPTPRAPPLLRSCLGSPSLSIHRPGRSSVITPFVSGHGCLSRQTWPAGAIDESSSSTLHGRTRCPLWLRLRRRRRPWGLPRSHHPRGYRTGCVVAGRGRGRTLCTCRRRWMRKRGRVVRAAAAGTGCSFWRRWRRRRNGRLRRRRRGEMRMRGPLLASSPMGRRKKGMRRRARRRRRGRGGGRSTAGWRVWTPWRTPSLSSGGCRASSPASLGRSRTCRRWPAAREAARTCWPSRRTPSTSGAGSSAAAPSGGSPPHPLPRCRLSWRRPSRPSTSETTVSSTAVAPAVADQSIMIHRGHRSVVGEYIHMYAREK